MSCRNLLFYTISRKEYNWGHPTLGIMLFLEAIGPVQAVRYFPTRCLSVVESPKQHRPLPLLLVAYHTLMVRASCRRHCRVWSKIWRHPVGTKQEGSCWQPSTGLEEAMNSVVKIGLWVR